MNNTNKSIQELTSKLYVDIVKNGLEDFIEETKDLLSTILDCNISISKNGLIELIMLLSMFYIEDEDLINILQEYRKNFSINYYNSLINTNQESPVSIYAKHIFD